MKRFIVLDIQGRIPGIRLSMKPRSKHFICDQESTPPFKEVAWGSYTEMTELCERLNDEDEQLSVGIG